MTESKAEVVVESLAQHGVKLMEIHKDKTKIRRDPAKELPIYDDNYRRLQKNRTCYIKVLVGRLW